MEWTDRLRDWIPPEGWGKVLAVDAHTEGEPLRVVLAGFPADTGDGVLAWRRRARREHDGLRRALMWEPRGHADMYGCIVGPPASEDADISVLFTHNDGFSTMCGHGIIGVVTVLLETGVLDRGTAGGRVVGIDTPAGFVEATARMDGGRVSSVAFRNVPSFVTALDARVEVDGVGTVRFDLAYGGAFYAYVDAADFGLDLVPSETGRLVDLGRRIKDSVQAEAPPSHPEAEDLGFVYGTIFVGPPRDPRHHSRNVCVFADGEVDRCPTGTGVSGRLAIHRARGQVEVGEEVVVESILGTCFGGSILSETRVGRHPAVVPRVSGRAWITGVNRLLIDPDDPLAGGFLLR